MEFYGWSLKVDGRARPAIVLYASISISFALLLNVAAATIALLVASEVAFAYRPTPASIASLKRWLILAAAIILGANYFYFARGHRYKTLVQTYAENEVSLAAKSQWGLVAYMGLSFLAVVGSLLALTLVNRDPP